MEPTYQTPQEKIEIEKLSQLKTVQDPGIRLEGKAPEEVYKSVLNRENKSASMTNWEMSASPKTGPVKSRMFGLI